LEAQVVLAEAVPKRSANANASVAKKSKNEGRKLVHSILARRRKSVALSNQLNCRTSRRAQSVV